MSYESKMTAAEAAVNQHNLCLPEDGTKLDWSKIRSSLVQMGGTTEASLRDVTWEDLQQCGIPRILARSIANSIFRASSDVGDATIISISDKKAANMSIEALLTHYDPTGFTNPAVTRRLKELVGDKPCIVLGQDSKVIVEASSNLVRDVINYLPSQDSVVLGDSANQLVLRTLRVGERPDSFADENPLFPGSPLRSNEQCAVCDRSWKSVPHIARQILYLAVSKTGELTNKGLDDVHRVHDFLEQHPLDAVHAVQKRYRKAAVLLNELAQTGGAPTLRVRKGAVGASSLEKPNDPFFGKHVRT